MLVFAAHRWKRQPDRPRWRGFGWAVEAGVRAGTGRPRLTLSVCALLALAGVFGATRLTLDTDLRRLRPTDHPAAAAELDLAQEFGIGIGTSTVTVPGRSVAEALDRADAIAGLARAALPAAEVSSPSDWVISGERLRARLSAMAPLQLAAAADRLSAALDREGLDVKAFAPALDGLRAIGAGREPSGMTQDSWPDWIADSVHEGEGATLVVVRIRIPEGAWPGGPPASFLASVQAEAPGAQVANAVRLGAELRSVAVRDLKRLGGLAIGVVLAIVLLSYRGDLGATALTFLPVILGTVWTAGLWGSFGRSLDLFSLCVLPVMVGIGVDDGLHVLHLARRRGEDLERASLDAGRGVVLTNLTTCAGFASLCLSHVPALRNGGLLICVGNLLCLAATLVALPAVDALRRK
jgi:predicted RND superfamily exporter protein